ncbi:LCP family protein [Agrococcus jejuensis]|uniref:Cell envelope-related function transcriptional attenuator common domain-containing protein n=1 Tax=Agrococcus jejuensis TaxID=399736 RepID=A0A1G8B8U4_9MICO|nr:LCP family protein [Agrococcus jejuensis]SDH29521.1 cell envelope-related function transcriptional attenuator common domain-containing protein [Agrococcus jejuensis]
MSTHERTSDAATGRRRRAPWSRRRKVVVGIASGLVLALVATIGVFAIRLQTSSAGVERVEEAFPDESVRPEVDDAGALNYLLLGSDSRSEGGSLLDSLGDRADTILLVHVPPDRQTVQVMSIMRDSWVDIPGYGMSKINAALSYGGVPLMVQTVEQLIDQRIDDVAIIDFAGFEGLTDALGGVTVQNEIAFSAGHSGPIHSFAAGEITLDGASALDYVRERYAFSDGDYQRVRNQQAYMRGLLAALLEPSVVANPVAIADLVEVMAPYMATTDGLTTTGVLGIATEFVGAGVPDVRTFTMPTTGIGTVGTQSVVLVDDAALQLVREAFAAESMTDFVAPEPVTPTP